MVTYHKLFKFFKGHKFMKHRVLNKQKMSKMCLVCGLENKNGIKAQFYELDNNELVALCKLEQEMQSYPQRVHGGISAALLDETIGRVIMIGNPNTWGVTAEFSLKYKRPVPLEVPLKVVGRITRKTRLIFEGTGEIILPNGEVAVTASGKYMIVPYEKISENHSPDLMRDYIKPDDPEYIELSY